MVPFKLAEVEVISRADPVFAVRVAEELFDEPELTEDRRAELFGKFELVNLISTSLSELDIVISQ